MILPDEKERIERLAKENNLDIKILPSDRSINNRNTSPSKILAYQMMGIEKNGNTCPFLDTESGKQSPHNGFPCKIP